jgi:hypothetical protein
MTGRACGNCKHFFSGGQFSECRRNPIDNHAMLLGIGPPTSKHPNGTPIIHLEVRYRVTHANTAPCGEWAVRLETARTLNEVIDVMPILGGNGGPR